MFSKVFIAWKRDYGEKIVLKICSILREVGVEYAFHEPEDCDFAITVGGDGTVMMFQSALECPLIGINPGKSVGFYTTASVKDFEMKLKKIMEGREGKDYFVRDFTRIEASLNRKPLPFYALNEVLVSPIFVRRIFDAELEVKGKKTKERNSGILVYTPSGSNAYAKSAGVKPLKINGKFGVAAIAPYAGRLTRGEMVLESGHVVIKCLNDEGEVCFDGQEDQVCKIKQDDVVVVKKSAKPAKIVCFSK
jgi:NAD+ kinase